MKFNEKKKSFLNWILILILVALGCYCVLVNFSNDLFFRKLEIKHKLLIGFVFAFLTAVASGIVEYIRDTKSDDMTQIIGNTS